MLFLLVYLCMLMHCKTRHVVLLRFYHLFTPISILLSNLFGLLIEVKHRNYETNIVEFFITNWITSLTPGVSWNKLCHQKRFSLQHRLCCREGQLSAMDK